MKMRDLLTSERVIPSLRARDKRSALREVATHASVDAAVPAAAIVRSVLESAELPAFGPGAGVSVPHAFVPGLGRPIATFARLEPAVDFGAADGSQTDLVALLLSPAERAGDHLRALACIARTLRNPNVRHLLRAAKGRDSVYVILCGSEEQQRPRAPAPTEKQSGARS
jgi:PTS system nitrogen regulatory IIA component